MTGPFYVNLEGVTLGLKVSTNLVTDMWRGGGPITTLKTLPARIVSRPKEVSEVRRSRKFENEAGVASS